MEKKTRSWYFYQGSHAEERDEYKNMPPHSTSFAFLSPYMLRKQRVHSMTLCTSPLTMLYLRKEQIVTEPNAFHHMGVGRYFCQQPSSYADISETIFHTI